MNLESQVCSFELAKRLKELGIKQSSLFFWTIGGIVSRLEALPILDYNYSAFTVAELGEMLPYRIHKKISEYGLSYDWIISMDVNLCIYYKCEIGGDELYPPDINHDEETEANARAKCLIMLLENKLIILPV